MLSVVVLPVILSLFRHLRPLFESAWRC
jgi:hypothetical protein